MVQRSQFVQRFAEWPYDVCAQSQKSSLPYIFGFALGWQPAASPSTKLEKVQGKTRPFRRTISTHSKSMNTEHCQGECHSECQIWCTTLNPKTNPNDPFHSKYKLRMPKLNLKYRLNSKFATPDLKNLKPSTQPITTINLVQNFRFGAAMGFSKSFNTTSQVLNQVTVKAK
jgi:hypothetical protein